MKTLIVIGSSLIILFGRAHAASWIPYMYGTPLGTCYMDTQSIYTDKYGTVSVDSVCDRSTDFLDVLEINCYRHIMRDLVTKPNDDTTLQTPWRPAPQGITRMLCGR